jgi:hypothetical protein
MERRERLSTIITSWPFAERWSEVGHPQKPSPPRIMIFIDHSAYLLGHPDPKF